MGILGLPNVGKSSLFNLLTEQSAAAENYPFCTIDPNESIRRRPDIITYMTLYHNLNMTGRCPVPDARFDWLCELWNSPSKIPAYLHITDIAGLIKGASGCCKSMIFCILNICIICIYSQRELASETRSCHISKPSMDFITS